MTKKNSTTDNPQAQQALIQSALTAFATFGINGVSLRTITANAGQHNQSAIKYYFEDKQGLVEAVLAYVKAMLEPEMAQSIAELESKPPTSWTAHALTELICRPFIRLDTHNREGHIAIKFMSRLTWQEGGQGQQLLVHAVQPYFSQFLQTLLILNPGKPTNMMVFQIYLAVNTLIHGLADVSLLTSSPTEGVEHILRNQPNQMMDYFIGYIAGGLFNSMDKLS